MTHLAVAITAIATLLAVAITATVTLLAVAITAIVTFLAVAITAKNVTTYISTAKLQPTRHNLSIVVGIFCIKLTIVVSRASLSFHV